jgi:hypothetical protein
MKRIVPLVLLLAACGDDHKRPGGDGGVDVPTVDAADPVPRAVVVVGDFNTTGVLSTIDPKTREVVMNAVTGVAQGDPVVRHIGNELFVINRFGGDSVTILDAKTLALKDQLSTGANSNPQDVAIVGQKLYLPALGTAGVVVATRGSTTLKTIDIGAAISEPDGKPDCVSAYAVGTDIYVACDLLQNFVPRAVGKIVVIDTTNDTVKTSFDLPTKNPQGWFVQTPSFSTFAGDLLIATLDFSDLTKNCVARVGKSSASCAIMNQALGGTPFRMAVQQDEDAAILWLAVVSGFDNASGKPNGTLQGFDLVTGMLWPAPISKTGLGITDVAVCPGNFILVADAKQNAAGIRVYEGGNETTTAPLAVGLPNFAGNQLACFDAR